MRKNQDESPETELKPSSKKKCVTPNQNRRYSPQKREGSRPPSGHLSDNNGTYTPASRDKLKEGRENSGGRKDNQQSSGSRRASENGDECSPNGNSSKINQSASREISLNGNDHRSSRKTPRPKEDRGKDKEKPKNRSQLQLDKETTSHSRKSSRSKYTQKSARSNNETDSASNHIVLNMFFEEVKKIDKLTDYSPLGDEPCLESISEILFKQYPWPLKLFSTLICFSQFLTLACLFYSLLPCPEEKPSWLVVVGVPLACAYAGIEAIHHMLRYIHLSKEYRGLIFLVTMNCLMQLLCVGVVMGKSTNLLSMISNFVGVAVVLQIDELLASYIRIKDIDTELLGEKSWRTKMRLKSKIFLIVIAGSLVYAVTIVIWRMDSYYCDAYKFDEHQ